MGKTGRSLRPGTYTFGGFWGPGPNGGLIIPLGDKMFVFGEEAGDGSKVMSKDEYEAYLNQPQDGGNTWGGWGGSWSQKGMKDGGVVRGCGKAQRGRTRGKVV